MCEHCDGKLLFAVGELKGIVSEIKNQQTELHKTVTDNRIAEQKESKDLSKDITNLKLRVVGVGAVFGSIAGFLARYIPS